MNRAVVVGRDAAAWLTALGLQRAFGRTGLEVAVVEQASLLSQVDAYAALPTLGGLHRLLGIDEHEVIAACDGVYVLGQRFANWSAGAAPFLHAYDTQPMGVNNVDLVQYWIKARAEGMKVPFEDFSLGAAMAKHGRLAMDPDLSDGFARPAYGFHLDARAYVALVKARALRSGVRLIGGGLGEIHIDGERVVAIETKAGERIEADLFIDATGSEAALIGRLPGSEFESWRRWLPCDRLLAGSAPRLESIPGFSQISAFRAGWIGLYPLQHRTAVVAAYDSSQVGDGELADALPVLAGARLQGQAFVSPLEPGLRPRSWIGNCVAVGDAAVSLEPLDAVQPHLIQTALSLLISLFPGNADDMGESAAFNAGLALNARNIRDFQIAHYKLNQRRGDRFWNRVRDMELPYTLAYKLRLFAARGRVALYDDEAFQAPNWTSILLGHGLVPRDFDPLVDLIEPQDQVLQMQRMLGFIASEVNRMPTLQSQLDAANSGRGRRA
ncbi:MAG TPA: tryptophan halogenase family protein [Caulobacteraceae bacterium]|nr:tryptophan halogenase family protein [Caulobacteraceae bacterium]